MTQLSITCHHRRVARSTFRNLNHTLAPFLWDLNGIFKSQILVREKPLAHFKGELGDSHRYHEYRASPTDQKGIAILSRGIKKIDNEDQNTKTRQGRGT